MVFVVFITSLHLTQQENDKWLAIQEMTLDSFILLTYQESLPSVNVYLIVVCFNAYFTKLMSILTVGSTNSLVSENVQTHFHHLLQRKPHEVNRDDNNRLTVCSNSPAEF